MPEWEKVKTFVYVALVACALGAFLGIQYEKRKIASMPRDTVQVPVTPPPAIEGTAKSKPAAEIKWRTRTVQDTAGMDLYRQKADSLIAQNDSLRERVAYLMSPKYMQESFEQRFERGLIAGELRVAHYPLNSPLEQFRYELKFTKLEIPQITIHDRPAIWVKPAVAVGGAATVYFAGRGQTTEALISGGVTILLTVMDW